MKITQWFNSIINFVKESYIELKKVSWLSRKEVVASTIIVIVIIVVMSLYIGAIDFVLAKLVSLFIGGRM